MSALTHDNPIIQEAYAELQRFYADGETREKIREIRRFVRDYEIGMGASRADGIAEGKAVGKAEGKAEGKTDAIIRFLTRRFTNVPQEICDRLYSITDIAELDRLTDIVADCDTLEEFTSSF